MANQAQPAKSAKPAKLVSPRVAHAQMQAWVVSLLTLVAHAYDSGEVLGAGVQLGQAKNVLAPDVSLLLSSEEGRPAISEVPALAVSILSAEVTPTQRRRWCEQYADAGVHEYWQIDIDAGLAQLYQRNAAGQFDEIPPDGEGLHYSSVIAELVFPVVWFVDRPNIWQMMDWWGLIDEEEE